MLQIQDERRRSGKETEFETRYGKIPQRVLDRHRRSSFNAKNNFSLSREELPEGISYRTPEPEGPVNPDLDPVFIHSVLHPSDDGTPEPLEADHESLPVLPDVGALPLADVYTVHGNSMDSGYVSALVSGYQKDTLGSRMEILETAESSEVESCDATTVYSDEGSISGAELDVYKSELVDSLVEQVRKVGLGSESLEVIFEDLPSHMKAFALRLGQPGSSKAERDVMYFVHKYRQ